MAVKKWVLSATLLALSVFPGAAAMAAAGIDAVTVTTAPSGAQTYSINIQILILMTVLTLLPAGLLMMTSFTRIVIVLALLRQALGTQQTPTNQTLIGLALFLTFFVMSPVIDKVNVDAVAPYMKGEISLQQGLLKAEEPFKKFMYAQTRENDLSMFMDMAGNTSKLSIDTVPFTVLVPAFVTSELKTAFQIGFMIFIPFLIIDLVVASVLMAMGMMMLSPLIISLPFKIMLFVLVDGWTLVIGTLASSFYR
jgi:flagellar biosynthetic protein FliP